ncbi:Tail fiber domain-containing protein [Sulfidibacter corallicola]|uniref:Tail fiber domain-containing protein n=1 Tax=Sulfidibacter corallicola TaxID=2818388 RepID=A0A8A4TN43_SULCO|nr:tail fiber domain-containing protein [Sulfidibacter corallicola]QTD48005.1 tail fiber domain-containing protein [Sulfidibacter corallicola]
MWTTMGDLVFLGATWMRRMVPGIVFLAGLVPLWGAETPPVVVPLWLSSEHVASIDDTADRDNWLEVHYYDAPHGEPVFREPAERIWWIQGRPLLVLGASGYPFPEDLRARATAWVRLFLDGRDITVRPLVVYPRRDRVALSRDVIALQEALKQGTGMPDASYLAQIANFLAGNVSSLAVEGSSYNVTGFGEVINTSGEWVGADIVGAGTWDQTKGGIFYDGATAAEDHVGIATNAPTAALEVAGEDGVLFTGAFNQGNIPAEGAGTRLMWYPRKAAFRVGQVSSTTWNDVNVGSRSVAAGFDTTALGSAATAFGDRTSASGSASTALGLKASATGSNAVAMGNETTAQAFASLAIGQFNLLTGTTGSWVVTDPAFVIGNGVNASSRANALTAFKNGDLTIAGTGAQPGGGTWADASDMRLKRDVASLDAESALRELLRLEGVLYRWQNPEAHADGVQAGLIAQQVAEVFPDWVTHVHPAEVDQALVGEDARVLAIRFPHAFNAYLIQALKALKARNDALEARLSALEAR